MSIGFGVFVPQGWRMDLVEIADPVEQYEAMTAVAKVADAGPWDSIWVYDHFHTVPEPTINTTFEAWTVSSTLARDTSRVNIGQMVGCNGYRHPALYAKIASTVDVASHGRLYAGLGAGWYEHEWKAYGYEWSEVPERMAAFREAVEIVHRMWTEERPVFTGKHYRIDQPINEPKGVRKPHPSFWLGGGGEKVTLKLVAKYADGANFGNGDPEIVRQKAAVLRAHCDRLERDYDRIRKSTSYHLDPSHSSAQHIAKVEQLAEAGADYVIVYIPRVAYDHEPLLRFAEEVVPQFA
ncbi:LLM class F420-dependent oxidoreductase [Actinoplanes xinjiangensis]|uniref:F420-dependent oxidoreductase-like protein n=1 Tax=Actinoplanes xinjiangensis TaxID=512350 RepID=A0A316F9P0_9ACTN|nr:LLM class F420-dependent oxidoreductase [Actinoplanes xinjiangensis]PWK42739.1 F420-dependent oxidoreductase-like protein [Actinoplanes xinjiangensis]GIF38301.1 LLM class F420-dependent oxidoreductase [Actinoplanes xinjiangensis]